MSGFDLTTERVVVVRQQPAVLSSRLEKGFKGQNAVRASCRAHPFRTVKPRYSDSFSFTSLLCRNVVYENYSVLPCWCCETKDPPFPRPQCQSCWRPIWDLTFSSNVRSITQVEMVLGIATIPYVRGIQYTVQSNPTTKEVVVGRRQCHAARRFCSASISPERRFQGAKWPGSG